MAENFKSLASYLTSLGLGELFTVDSKGNPGGFLYEQMQAGVETAAELKIALEGNDTFRKRYKVIFDMRERANKGETVATPTVEDVRDYEVNYARRMAQYGVPASFYDSFEDAHKALATNLTIDQITDRIDSSYKIIKTLPQEVKDTFNEYYGDMAGEQGLLMAILDPTKANDVFEKSTRAAAFGGFGKKQNITFSRQQSEDYAALGKDVSSAASDVANVANLSSLASSNLGESGSNLVSDVAFKAGALNDVEAQKQLQDRLLGRKVRQSDTTGGALTTTKGIVGA
tara:strand:+ start:4263 stop:5120 length:858 start_codon:yes stop_codon:yes gene_type:complete